MFQLTRPRGARRGPGGAVNVPASFNSRARVGRDDVPDTSGLESVGFQLTRPRGARPANTALRCSIFLVSTHAPAWGATSPPLYLLFTFRFQLTRPRGARPAASAVLDAVQRGFNSRARVGRDLCQLWDILDVLGVSTHAPAWGATEKNREVSLMRASFNSRARVGRDPCYR